MTLGAFEGTFFRHKNKMIKTHLPLFTRVLFMLALVGVTAQGLAQLERTLESSHNPLDSRTSPRHWISDTITRGTWGVSEMLAYDPSAASSAVLGVTTSQADQYQAAIVGQSNTNITLKPGKAITVWVDVQNTGTAGWRSKTGPFIALNAAGPAGRVSAFRSTSWDRKPYRVLRLPRAVGAAHAVRLRFVLRAPKTEGTYVEQFGLVAENLTWISGGTVSFTVTVGNPVPPSTTPSTTPAPLATAAGEPIVRVGITSTTKPVVVQSTTPFLVTAGGTSLFQNVTGPIIATVSNGTATVTDGTTSLTTDQPVRFSPASTTGLLEIVSYENRPAWNTNLNDNIFRGTIEVSAPVGKTSAWIINELPMEQYLHGLAEVTNTQPSEYLKALITAARSYATYHYLTKTKHAVDNYDLNATTDQVYRGYGFEQRAPNVAAAVEATTGQVMTNAAAISAKNPTGVIIGAYSACTDGTTRSFTSVFGGDPAMTPYLVSVPDPDGICTNARYLQGLDGNHMVGLSAAGARAMADNDKTAAQILAAYYTGVTIAKQY